MIQYCISRSCSMPVYGYARVSTNHQDLSIQQDALKAAGCSVIRAEKVSGSSRKNREQLNAMLEFLREGDVLVVTRIDRLARSIKDLQDIVHLLKSKGVWGCQGILKRLRLKFLISVN